MRDQRGRKDWSPKLVSCSNTWKPWDRKGRDRGPFFLCQVCPSPQGEEEGFCGVGLTCLLASGCKEPLTGNTDVTSVPWGFASSLAWPCLQGFLWEHLDGGECGRCQESWSVLSPSQQVWNWGAWLGKGLSLPSGRQRVNLQSSLAVLPLDRACWDFLPAVLHHEDLCAGEIPGHSCN